MCPAPTVLRKKPLNLKVEARSRQDFVLMGVKGVELGSPMRYPPVLAPATVATSSF
jgi:hypothetical protein